MSRGVTPIPLHPRVLVIQSGPAALAVRAMAAARSRFPGARLAILVRADALAALPAWDDVEVIVSEGPKPAFVRALRARRVDAAVILLSGQPGFWKLQSLPAVLGAGAVLALDEELRWIPIRPGAPLLAHVSRRIGRSEDRLASVAARAARTIARVGLAPITLAWLAGYERVVSAAARLRGGADWKRDHRPGSADRRRSRADGGSSHGP